MANNVLKTLQSMEAELAAIKSAKEQVESVVAVDATINSSLRSYSEALANLSVNIGNIKQSFEEVISTVTDEANQFGSSLNKRKEEIKTATKELATLLDCFKKQTETIGVITIAQRTEKMDKKCDDLSERLRALDKKIDYDKAALVVDFNNKVNEIIDKILSNKNKIIAELDDNATKVNDSITSAESNIIESITSNNTTAINKINETNATLKNLSSGIKVYMDTLNTEMDTLNTEIATANKKMMYFGKTAILLLLIDIILHFI